MHLVELSIKNFRGIKSFHHIFGEKQLICLVGQGDSGKTTILEAISLALSPTWNIPFCDNDFYMKNVEEPIEIEVSVKIPEIFVLESKFGLYMRFWDAENSTISDVPIEGGNKIITIKLEVKDNLEPKWYVYNNCQEENYKEISNSDRAKFNCFMISDYTDKHFAWSQGSPLNSLISKKELNSTKNNAVEPLRNALNTINSSDFETFNKTFSENVKTPLVDIDGVKTLMDSKEIYYNQNKLSLHDKNGIPFRSKGKGTRRLLSAILQFTNKEDGSITLIDELEQGLEPYRVKTFVRELKNELSNKHQIFITTHSANVITEVNANNIIVIRNNNGLLEAIDVSTDLQRIIRAFPDALFSKKLIVCEGSTEYGICNQLDEILFQQNNNPMFLYGCMPINSNGGSKIFNDCTELNKLKYNLLAFCDTDVSADNEKKERLKNLGVKICDCEIGNCIEKQLFKDLPYDAVINLIEYVIEKIFGKSESSFIGTMKRTYSNINFDDWRTTDTDDIRNAFAEIANNNSWYKSETGGRKLGEVISTQINNIDSESHLKKQLEILINWVKRG